MTLESARGVILRMRLLTESSLIVHWLTEEQGRLATVAQGARRPRSPFRGKLDLWYEAAFSFQRRRRSDLHGLREVVVIQTHAALRTHWPALRQVAYASLLVEAATEPESPVRTLYRLFSEFLAASISEPAVPVRLLAFELQLLGVSGWQPPLDRSPLSAGARHLAQTLATVPLARAAGVRFDPLGFGELERFLGRFLGDQLGRVPRGRQEALAAGVRACGNGAGA